MFRGSVKGTGYPLHSPASPSLPLPCVTVCHHISTGTYMPSALYMDGGSNSFGRKEFFTPIENPNGLWGPNSLLFKGYRGSFLEVKGPVCDIHQSPPSRVEVKNEWSYNSSPLPFAFVAWTRTALPCYIFLRLSPSADDQLHFPGCSDARK